ncbi:M48 family metallopeptidase [bacterium]|nr:M48 family metallopeptidase [bacterium]
MSTSITEIQVANIPIDVVRKDIKNMHLAVYPPTGRVRLAVPSQTPDSKLRLFAIKKLGWIKKNVKLMESQVREPQRQYVDRESHYYLGTRYLMKCVQSDQRKVKIKNKTLYFHFPKLPNVPKSEEIRQKEQFMRNWYRSKLEDIVPGMIRKWELKLGVVCNNWSTRFMRTKWGSCNAEKGTILLNVELAKKPEQCIEYVVLHEMIHFKERKHNQNFIQHLDYHMPGWEYVREELNRIV